jgi:DNA-binding CsgD family transcriptional regulator
MSKNKQKMYIYGLKSPLSYEPRYVGFTSKTLNERLLGHIWEANSWSAPKTYKNNWIKSLTKKGIKPEIFEIEQVTEENWAKREQFWIKTLKQKGYKLTNSTDGGEGTWGYKQSKKLLKYLSKIRKGKHRRGVPHSEATKLKISQSKKNPSKKTRKKISEANKKRPDFKEHMKKMTELARIVSMKKKRKLTDEQIVEIKKMYSQGFSMYKIGKIFNVTPPTIFNTLRNKLKYQNQERSSF